MPYSKLNHDLEFNDKSWAVSLVNTQTGLSGVFGGHAKIVIEGVRTKPISTPTSLYSNLELFIGEYHIMEANRIPEEKWIPQALRNTQCNYLVLFTERTDYTARQEQQYSRVSTRSVGGIQPTEALKMISVIKDEKQKIDSGEKIAKFQYAGKWCLYGTNNAQSCISWAETQLDIIGLGKHLITDSSKASPYLHVSSGKSCSIL